MPDSPVDPQIVALADQARARVKEDILRVRAHWAIGCEFGSRYCVGEGLFLEVRDLAMTDPAQLGVRYLEALAQLAEVWGVVV